MRHSGSALVGVVVTAILSLGACHSRADRVDRDASADRGQQAEESLGSALAPPPAVGVGGGRGPSGGAEGGVVGGVVGGLPGAPPPPAPLPASAAVPVPTSRKLTRNASVTIEVPSLDPAMATLRGQTDKAGGYVSAESRMRSPRGTSHGSLILRIPAARLDAFLAALPSVGTVERSQSRSDDITEAYFDVELHLSNQRQLQARLLDLLNRSGNKLSDLLETERELARVRGEIEQLEGRQRLFDSEVALSAVSVDVHEPLPAIASGGGGPLAALRRSFAAAADNFVYAVAAVIEFIGGTIPVAAALLAALWLAVKWWQWRKRRKHAKTAAA